MKLIDVQLTLIGPMKTKTYDKINEHLYIKVKTYFIGRSNPLLSMMVNV